MERLPKLKNCWYNKFHTGSGGKVLSPEPSNYYAKIFNMKFNTITILVLLMLFVLPAVAQPGFGDDVDDVPVDSGLSLLIAAGVGYGIKKVKQARKHQNEKQQF
jgi:hypothetical protein